MSGDDDQTDGESGIATKTRPKTQRPPMYKVMILNDDYTPMEFVVHVLERFFGLSHSQAFELMLTVHKKGLAVVGVFTIVVTIILVKLTALVFPLRVDQEAEFEGLDLTAHGERAYDMTS